MPLQDSIAIDRRDLPRTALILQPPSLATARMSWKRIVLFPLVVATSLALWAIKQRKCSFGREREGNVASALDATCDEHSTWAERATWHGEGEHGW